MRPLNSVIDSSKHALYNIFITHCQTIKLGRSADIYATNNILSRYTRCSSGGLTFACNLFDEMSHRDTVTWNTMISGYVNSGSLGSAWELYKSMKSFGLMPDAYTFGSILKGVACACRLDVGQQVHSLIVKMGYEEHVYAGSALLDMYAKCERVRDAFMVFKCIPRRNSVSWNALIAGFVLEGDHDTAFWLLRCMEEEGVRLDDGTFSPLLTLLDEKKFYKLTMQLHCKIIKHGVQFDNTVCNATITSYSQCGSLEDAERVFDGAVGSRDLVTWNSMLAAFLAHDRKETAFKLFLDMQQFGFEPDIYTYTTIISACSHKDNGKSLHGLVIKRGLEQLVPICNAVIAMYLESSSNSMEDALNVFHSMESKDRVSWNSILTGFSQTGHSENALKLFVHMRFAVVDIDHYAFSAVLRSCSDLATLQLGQQIHVLTVKSGFESNDFVASSLIFMYSKCGMIEDARKSFEKTAKDSSITWNSIMFAYAQHGQGDVALGLFFQMRDKKVKMDHITFVAALTACSHIGLVEQGRYLLKSMASDYGISPRMEHYACAVDLFGRAGYLDEAKALIESMPFDPDAMVWKTLLGACRACGDIELAAQVASHLLELEPEEHCTYVILSNMYGHLKRWDEKACMARLMRERKVKKVPGWSWIEVKNEVHAFIADDRCHSHFEEIYQILEQLMEDIKWLDSVAGSDSLLDDVDYSYTYFNYSF
ncbi:pentatricopeptide repeat-containing protein, putative [Ricinus communis]|uniref:Pentatricopeptide repeat-containing protein, putative n=1 Tax=Ricinus communis TaxID=3988 RepID=B9T517_RICCO|nr:pentatricopeptide repeat-containing protein, putative [Ricinus communis]|eukprot:XP_002533336.1 putative pentatricopeptide repeat-containing protein At3g25970 [Ricinus communis]